MIKSGTPFRAAQMMALAIAAAIAQAGHDATSREAAIRALGPYQGRGKGKARTHDQGGSRAFQRVAAKRRNTIKFRRANRG